MFIKNTNNMKTVINFYYFVFILFVFLNVANLFNMNCTRLSENQIDDKYITRGLIQEVKSDSLKNYDFFILKDIDNNEYVFQQGNSNIIGFSPSHLREHMLLGLPVSVEYYIYDGSYIVINLYD